MKIKKVAITNFRTIKSAEFYFFPYMVFVGKNNSGKSNIMKALDVFFGRKPVDDDFRLENRKIELDKGDKDVLEWSKNCCTKKSTNAKIR